ncbi:ATP-dependent Clp protease proteolytic subunit [Azospirillum sp. sgz302134]
MRALLTVLALLVSALLVSALPCAAETTSIAPPPAVDADLTGTVTARVEGERVRVTLSGVITPAVAATFIGALDAVPAARPVLVELDSPGGFVKAGYAMIDAMLRHRAEGRRIDTLVRGSATCESMCVGVFMAGARRAAEPGAYFMVHAPRDDRTGTMTLRTTQAMMERLIGLGTSPAWIRTVADQGGFSGRLDYGTRAEALVEAGANIVTELVAAR